MAGENTAYPLLTAKAGAVIAEGLKLSLATPGGGLTPSTITAMVGIKNGQALDLAPEVKTVMSKLNEAIPPTLGVDGFGFPIPNPKYHPGAAAALSNLENLQGQLLPPGNHGALGSFLSQAQSHIKDSIELKNVTGAISNMNFEDLGSGITNMSSMLDQGLTSKLGNLSSAGNAMAATGKLFDPKDMANFGSGAGLVNQLNANKLGNSTGLNEALSRAGVDLSALSDPVYKENIDKVLGSVQDSAILRKIQDQLEVSPTGAIGNLSDLLNVNKLVPSSQLSGINGGLSDIGKKMSDLGAQFTSPTAAKNMLNNLSIPSIPNLNAAAPSLKSLMLGHESTIDDMIGKGLTDSPNGIPNITDFAGVVGGGGAMLNLSKSANISDIVSGVNAQVTKTTSMLDLAGIDVTSPPLGGLSSAKNFAEGLHKFGADTSGSGVSQLLGNMAKSGNQFGDAIKASLAEGKNRAIMQASGIPPLNFDTVPANEAIKNLQQGKFIPGTGSMTPQQINSIFGGGTLT